MIAYYILYGIQKKALSTQAGINHPRFKLRVGKNRQDLKNEILNTSAQMKTTSDNASSHSIIAGVK